MAVAEVAGNGLLKEEDEVVDALELVGEPTVESSDAVKDTWPSREDVDETELVED
jgi:hypothetical protein